MWSTLAACRAKSAGVRKMMLLISVPIRIRLVAVAHAVTTVQQSSRSGGVVHGVSGPGAVESERLGLAASLQD